MLKAPGMKRLKLKYDDLLLSFDFNLRRYNEVHWPHSAAGACGRG